MFGFGDLGVWSAYAFTIFSVLICILYGILKWNETDEDTKETGK